MKSVRSSCELFTASALLLAVVTRALELNVTNDGPAILDSTITFMAKLESGGYTDLYFQFRHNVPHAKQEYWIENGTMASLALTFESSHHPSGDYVMEVTAYESYFFSKHKVAFGKCRFTLTRDIVGRIVVSQDNRTLPNDRLILATNRTTNFTFELHDPSGYFNNSVNSFSWKLDYGHSVYAPYLEENFTDTRQHTVYLVVVALVSRPNSTSQVVKVGSFTRDVAPKDPITSVSVEGNVWLRHGDVVSLQVSCNGSAPYNYCWKYFPGNTTSNSTANLTCEEPISTNMCRFPLVHYFPQDGPHLIAIILSNVVQSRPFVKNIEVHIYDVSHKGLLSMIILPITCSLLAIVIIVTGAAYHVHTRSHLHVEVADFDFQRGDHELTERTFWEHLLSAWRDAFPGCVRPHDPYDTDDEHPEFDNAKNDLGGDPERSGVRSSGGETSPFVKNVALRLRDEADGGGAPPSERKEAVVGGSANGTESPPLVK
ncbi:unnamed protein product [Ixodes persulcatus]